MKATAGAGALPPAMRGHKQKRRSDRHKSKQGRRSMARKVLHNANDTDEYRTAVWVDALEGVDPSAAAPDDDEEYDELEDLQDEKKRKRPRKSKGQQKVGTMPKRFLPRSLGTILVEEANRGEDGAARAFLAAVARVPADQQLPRRKFCPLSGTFGIYTEPKSGIPYSSLRALDQIRERPPPWMTTLSGAAAYYEATKSIEDE
jgi:hypothetical protein